MLQSVEAIVDPSGRVRLLETLRIDQPCRAVVTLLAPSSQSGETLAQASADDVANFLDQTRLSLGASLTPQEIDAQIEGERSAWE